MSLSKKNLDKLNNFIKNKNSVNNNISKKNNIDKIENNHKNQAKLPEPSEIFYSLVDNSENLNETSKVNNLLRNSEKYFINKNHKKIDYSKNLTKEDELYDEFNYLLEE